jgi:hypothetical protein
VRVLPCSLPAAQRISSLELRFRSTAAIRLLEAGSGGGDGSKSKLGELVETDEASVSSLFD